MAGANSLILDGMHSPAAPPVPIPTRALSHSHYTFPQWRAHPCPHLDIATTWTDMLSLAAMSDILRLRAIAEVLHSHTYRLCVEASIVEADDGKHHACA